MTRLRSTLLAGTVLALISVSCHVERPPLPDYTVSSGTHRGVSVTLQDSTHRVLLNVRGSYLFVNQNTVSMVKAGLTNNSTSPVIVLRSLLRFESGRHSYELRPSFSDTRIEPGQSSLMQLDWHLGGADTTAHVPNVDRPLDATLYFRYVVAEKETVVVDPIMFSTEE